MKKVLLYVMSLAIAVCAAIAGTVAYLTDTDEDVNVMTLGNVKIEQIEKQWNEDKTALEVFQNGNPLYPYVGKLGWENTDNDDGAYRRFTMNNVVDKYVTVKNVGKSDAYVRTLIALEMGSCTVEEMDTYVGVSLNSYNGSEFKFDGSWKWEFHKEPVVIDGKNYQLLEAVHIDPLEPGEETIPSLLQVYLADTATNEIVQKLDADGDGEYKILVYSQAVQTKGFENVDDAVTTFAVDKIYAAEVALDTAFYNVSKDNHPWEEYTVPNYDFVSTPQQLKDAMLIDGTKITLANDIVVDKDTPLQWGAYMFVANSGRNITIDLNGYNIIVEEDAFCRANALFTTANRSTLNIVGEGTVEIKNNQAGIFHAMNPDTHINVYGGTYISKSNNGAKALAIIYTNSGNVDIYGGKFIPLDGIECANAEDIQGNRLSIVFHEGTLLSHEKYYAGSDASRIQLEEGCTLKEVTVDGQTWYKVTK